MLVATQGIIKDLYNLSMSQTWRICNMISRTWSFMDEAGHILQGRGSCSRTSTRLAAQFGNFQGYGNAQEAVSDRYWMIFLTIFYTCISTMYLPAFCKLMVFHTRLPMSRFKREFDCDLQLLKATIIDPDDTDKSVVETIEPNLWVDCEIHKPLHRMLLAKAIRKLAGLN